jgi:hypothetical protein
MQGKDDVIVQLVFFTRFFAINELFMTSNFSETGASNADDRNAPDRIDIENHLSYQQTYRISFFYTYATRLLVFALYLKLSRTN